MSVIFSRAPLRISLGGGGTDLPSYYREHGGFLVAGAIDKYIYMLMHTVFQRRYKMKYSETEDVEEIAEIQPSDPARDARCATGAGTRWRSPRWPTCPPGPGWAPRARSRSPCSRAWPTRGAPRSPRPRWPRPAAEIEIDILNEPCGKQDPYVAAHGGICAYTFNPDGTVDVEPLELSPETLRALREQMLLFYTGEARDASAVLADQDSRTKTGDDEMLENMHRTKEMGLQSRDLLRRRRPVRLRRADARALAQQAQALARDGDRAASTSSTRWRAAAA